MAKPEIWEEGNGHGQRYNVAWTTAEVGCWLLGFLGQFLVEGKK